MVTPRRRSADYKSFSPTSLSMIEAPSGPGPLQMAVQVVIELK